MAKLKNLSIKSAAVLTMLAALFLATLFSALTIRWLEQESREIAIKYVNEEDRYYLTNKQGVQFGEGVGISNSAPNYSNADQRKIKVYEWLTSASVPFYFIVFIFSAGFTFYRWKIQRPLAILEEATAKIAQQDLDFSIHYAVDDEMGKLIGSFEKMRHELSKNNKLLWRTAEERKRVNAAFAHDLRTPLTVLKGYNSFILMNMHDERFTAQKLSETSKLMEKQILRLEGFVDSMNSVQRLEQLVVNKRNTTNHSIQQALKETTNILDSQSIVNLEFVLNDIAVQLDFDILLQVYENLLNNALRYAKSKINVAIKRNNTYLTIQMEDDGGGFDKQALQHVTSPFFRESKEVSETSFGLGLYISLILCEKHGGELKISNGHEGAKIIASFEIN